MIWTFIRPRGHFVGVLRLSNLDLVEYWSGLACRLALPSELKLKLLPARLGRLRLGLTRVLFTFVWEARRLQLSVNCPDSAPFLTRFCSLENTFT